MPCPSAGPKMFCESSNFLGQTKHGIAFSAALKDFVPTQELNLLVWHNMSIHFYTKTKSLDQPKIFWYL